MMKAIKLMWLMVMFSFTFSALSFAQTVPFHTSPENLIESWATPLLWVDLDNDGLKDIIASGALKHCWQFGDYSDCSLRAPSVYIYRNKGNEQFERLDFDFGAVSGVIVNAADFDNNGFMDIIISGVYFDHGYTRKTFIYKNHGNWHLEMLQPVIPDVITHSLSVVDFNNDGLMDFLVMHRGADKKTFLYKNHGNFAFSPIPTTIQGVGGSASWLDINRDGYADLLIAGNYFTERMDGKKLSAIYTNNGDGTFTPLKEVQQAGKSLWRDYNNDGSFDWVVAETDNSTKGFFNFYRNEGEDGFSHVNYNIPTMMGSQILWEDFDNDGDSDWFTIGCTWETSGDTDVLIYKSLYYEYEGGVYQPKESGINHLFQHNTASCIADIDNNGTLDLILGGIPKDENQHHAVYYKNQSPPNTPPAIPAQLSSSVSGNSVSLNWDASVDAQTHTDAITYNIRIGTTPGGNNIWSPPAVTATGELLKYERGAIQKTQQGYPVLNLRPGKYYWSVQAVDGGYMASMFAPEMTFTIDVLPLAALAPVSLSAKAISENRAEIDWVYPRADQASFIIERSDNDSLNFRPLDTLDHMTSRYLDKTLSDDTGYYYRIKTSLKGKQSDYSDTVFVKTRALSYFKKVFDSPLTREQQTMGVAKADFNNDGLIDLCVIKDDPVQVFRNLGNGEFHFMIMDQEIHDDLPYGGNRSVNWVDINNDGYLDLFVTQSTGYPNLIYINNEGVVFTQFTQSAITVDMGETLSAAWADYDRDGLVDVLICGFHHPILLFRNLGDNQFEEIPFANKALADTGGCSWVDYDNDGWPDIFVANYYHKNSIYRNNGDGTFQKITQGAIVNDNEPSVSGAWGDYDNDGFLDLLVFNNVNTDNSLYRNMGDGTFTRPQGLTFANRPGILGGGSTGAWEDINNNGNLDLFIVHGYNNRFLINEGESSFTEVTDEPFCSDFGDSFNLIWADLNNNGFLDLFIANRDKENFYYINNGLGFSSLKDKSALPAHNRVSIRLKGRNSNSFGIGSRIVVETQDTKSTRTIATQSGNISSTDGLIASVGIGPNVHAHATITWPTGYVQRVSALKINELNIIEEPVESVTSVANTAVDDFSLSLYPNPVHTHLQVLLSVNTRKITIMNISGMVMKSSYVQGRETFTIDVSDLTPGLYLLIAETEKGKVVRRFSKGN